MSHNGARAIRRDAQAGGRARRSGMAYSPSYAKAAQRISHNVPAVYDVFAVAIRETAGFQQPQKCVWSERGNGA